MEEKIRQIVQKAIAEMNEDAEEDEVLEYGTDVELFGKDKGVNSFSFVTMISSIEDQIYDEYGKEVYLVSPDAYEKGYNPFETIGTLEQYIAEVITTE